MKLGIGPRVCGVSLVLTGLMGWHLYDVAERAAASEVALEQQAAALERLHVALDANELWTRANAELTQYLQSWETADFEIAQASSRSLVERLATSDGPAAATLVDLAPRIESVFDLMSEGVDLVIDEEPEDAEEAFTAARTLSTGIDASLFDLQRQADGNVDAAVGEVLASVSTIGAQVRRAGVMLVLAAILAQVATAFLSFRLRRLASDAHRVARGDVEVVIAGVQRHDELGAVARAFESVVHSSREFSVLAARLAAGDANVEVQPRSDADALGHALADTTRYLRRTVKLASDVAAGDLSRDVDLVGDHDVLGREMQAMVEGLRGLLGQVHHCAERLMTAVEGLALDDSDCDTGAPPVSEVACALSSISRGVDAQRDAVASAATVATALIDSASIVASSALESERLGTENARSAADSRDVVGEALTTIGEIRAGVETSNSIVVELQEMRDRVAGTVDSITKISERTSLLALNASIEAANAGEHGASFAVVATEVRELARASATSADSIRTILGDIGSSIDTVVGRMGQTVDHADRGAARAEDARGALEIITGSAGELLHQSSQASTSAVEMSAALRELERTIESVRSIADDNASQSARLEESIEQGTGRVAALSAELDRLVQGFKV